MDVKRTIAELTSQLSEINYESDEDNVLFKGLHKDDYCDSPIEEDDFDNIGPSKLRKSTATFTLPEKVYGGKTTTRKKTYSSEDSSDEGLVDNGINVESLDQSSDEGSNDENDTQSLEEGEEELNGTEDEELSETYEEPTVPSKTEIPYKNVDDPKNYNIYSAESKNVANDVKKGFAIRNQLSIWETLLEGRIKLQQALVACNNLPPGDKLMKTKLQLDADNQLKMNSCKKNLLVLLGKLLDLQKDLVRQCPEFGSNKVQEINEEIPSDESEIEDENEKANEEDREDNQPPKKKRKLNDFSTLIQNDHSKFIPFRNACIQKWNDKTKVSSGKMANSNFSAFDQSTLKQIEQIMADRARLVNRTRVRRSENQDKTREPQEVGLDPEIFDDTDFYHKLLRDYIERKSMDVANSSQTERQLMELHKLRSKMKKNIDTKSTKGRKIRYVVLPKLVNFMAPNPYNTWSEEAETELYNSLFGKIKL